MSLCCSQGHKGHFKLSVCSTVLRQGIGVNSLCLVSGRFVPVNNVATASGVSACSFM